MTEADNKISVIVVGAGPCGVAASITIARAGYKVLLVERGDFAGSKNMYGGVMYTEPLKEIFPDLIDSAPIERFTTENKYAILSDETATFVSYQNKNSQNSFTAIRAKFDTWAVEQATKEGVYFAPKTVVRELLTKDDKVIGIKTDLEEYYSDIVILADGANSLLARQIGLRKDLKPSQMALGVKEVIKLNSETINNRFNVKDNQGVVYEIMGGPLKEKLALGFLYTNKDSITIGLGITLDEIKKSGKKPYEILDELKSHPSIAPLIEDGELGEYSAHLIPEGGFKAMPKLYAAGVMVAGDAAMMVNNLHWEGTNLALLSGKLAGEVAVDAIYNNNFSSDSLELYQKKLEKSFIYKDLKSYKSLMPVFHSRTKSFLGFYLEKINEFFKVFTSVNSTPKKQLFREYIRSFLFSRCICELVKDIWSVLRLAFEVLK